jgi:hypothetical protein
MVTETIIGALQKAFGGFDAGMLGEIHEVFDQIPLGAGPLVDCRYQSFFLRRLRFDQRFLRMSSKS